MSPATVGTRSEGSAGAIVAVRDGDGWRREMHDPQSGTASPPHRQAHRLTAAREATFRTDGFLLLSSIIQPDLVASALDAVDQMIYEYEQEKPQARGGVYTIISTLLKSGHTNNAFDQLMVLIFQHFVLKLPDLCALSV